jgi:hypothetical protein
MIRVERVKQNENNSTETTNQPFRLYVPCLVYIHSFADFKAGIFVTARERGVCKIATEYFNSQSTLQIKIAATEAIKLNKKGRPTIRLT